MITPGAESGQKHRGEGTDPGLGQVDDLDAGQGQRLVLLPCPGARLDGLPVERRRIHLLTCCRGSRRRYRVGQSEPCRGAGEREIAQVRVAEGSEETASRQVLVSEQFGGLHHLAADDLPLQEIVEHLFRRLVTHAPGQERKQAPNTLDGVLTLHGLRPLLVLDAQRRAVVAELVLGRRNERHPSVAAAMGAYAGRGTAVALGVHAGVLDPQQRQDGGQRLHLGHFDEAA